MCKAMAENKMTAIIKRLLSYFSLYWKLMCTDKNNYKNKKSLTPSSPPSTPVIVFLNAEKLLSV